ncbi:MAG: MBL fold metallo-hydrolase [Pseudomonadota bacterium]
MLRSVPTFFAAVTLTLAGCAADEAALVPSPSADESAGAATAILNAGVSANLGSGDAPAKFLFDPLYDDHFGSLQKLSPDLIQRIVGGAPPYDGVTAVFVSHAHGDHFSETHLARMLTAQPQLQLVAPQQAVERLRGSDLWEESFAARVIGIALENGEQSDTFEIAGATVEAFRSPHSGWPDRHAEVHNLTFRVSTISPAPQRSGEIAFWRVMHLGDADPGAEYFVPHRKFLSRSRTGLAIVPFWFLNTDDPESLVGMTLNSESAVGMHVPAREPGWLAGSGWDYFTGEGQQVPVPEVP